MSAKDKSIANAAKALGDSNRLLLLKEIATRGSINATKAQQIINLSQPNISYHIKELVNCELVGTLIYQSTEIS